MIVRFVMPVIFFMTLCVSAVIVADPKGAIPENLIDEWTRQTLSGGEKAMADIVANGNVHDVALNRERHAMHDNHVNYVIKTGDITNQKSSGRCWMFAGFNTLRPQVIKKYNLKSFEFSENYLMFWDKMEKVNMYLQAMIDLAGRPLDDRELQTIFESPIGDGGWWTYFVDLADKYGLVPVEVMPETYNSSSTGVMNSLLGLKVCEFGLELRRMANDGADENALKNRREEMMGEIYRILVLNLGQPPTEFTWKYTSKDDSLGLVVFPKKFTPKSFYKEVIDDDLSDYVALFNYPGKDYYQNYSTQWSRNIYERPNWAILNLPIDTLREYAYKSILDSTPVWFACDVGQENYGKDGIFALDIYNYELIYGTTFQMPKEDLIHTWRITSNHAMTFMGVDTADGRPIKWLVENSWGKDKGDDGKWYMYNDWFDRYLFGVIVNKRYLSDNLKKMAEKSPIELPPWDPMYQMNYLQ